MPKYTAGIVGFGERGKTLLTIIRTHIPEITVVSVYDPAESARDAATRLGLHACAAEEDFYVKPPNIVFVTTNAADHCQGVIAAAKHGCHIFVEKPLAVSPDEADQMVEAVKKAGIICTVDFETPFSDSFTVLRQELAREGFGKLTRIEGADKGRVPGYDLETCMPHFLQMIGLLMDSGPVDVFGRVILDGRLATREDIVPINSISSGYPRRPHNNLGMNADFIGASYRYGNGVVLNYNLARLDDAYVAAAGKHAKPGSQFMNLVFYGTRGQVKWHQTSGGYVYRKEVPQDLLNDSSWLQVYAPERPDPSWEIPTARLLQDFVRAIENGRQPTTSIEIARSIVEQVTGIYTSHLAGGMLIDFPLVNRENPLL
ncbi:MAG: Gfo/Idh/MocA family oxidoreductase [Candidatus Pacebacteria bacterium]|jgi:predicted dehydrogenase|nr:Gfo/Idh/MocA family oxidoreductase [Candidatus Paceibacterota bacterium]